MRNMERIGRTASEEVTLENVNDRWTDDRRRMNDGCLIQSDCDITHMNIASLKRSLTANRENSATLSSLGIVYITCFTFQSYTLK